MGRRQKYNSIKKLSHNTELMGILIMLISIIGLGKDKLGLVGRLISGLFSFVFGVWWFVGLIVLFVYGLTLLLKKGNFKILSSKLLGVILLLIGLLIISHVNYSVSNDIALSDTIKETVGQFVDSLKGNVNPIGGGMLGALFSIVFVKLFSLLGAKIVSIVLILIGAIVFFNVSIVDIFKFIVHALKSIRFKKSSKDIIINNSDDIDEEDNTHKKIISNLDELNNIDEKELSIPETNYSRTNNVNYILPNYKDLLDQKRKDSVNDNKVNIKVNVEKLERVLLDFDIVGKVVEVNVGPAVTQYEIELKSGTKVSRLLGINREISLALAAKDVRIQAPIPGRNTIGIEIPNVVNTIVTLREVMDDIPRSMDSSKLCVALGKNIMGKTIFMEINKTPHLLVAGATGSGKSACINSMIVSLMFRNRPDEVKMVLVDPKKVEMAMYNGIPHLLMPVVTDPKKASVALTKMVNEMERRYELFSETETKNILDYNAFVDKRNKNMNGDLERLPYIVIIIDELADLMLVAAKEVEDSITRITQMARASGIHLIVATQRPSTDVITGLVKANIPSRISFAVASSIDSRTILDMMGAEKLLGRGDMLFLPMGENTPTRIQGSYVTDEEVKRVVNYTVSQQKAQYDERYNVVEEKATLMHKDDEEYEDPLYTDIVEFVVRNQKASASLLQRKYKLGYNRAARIVDLLEERGIVGPQNGSKPREVLVKLEDDHDN